MRRAGKITHAVALHAAIGLWITVAIAWGIEALDTRPPRSAMTMTGAAGSTNDEWAAPVPEGWPRQPRTTGYHGQGGRIEMRGTSLQMKGAERLRFRQGMHTGTSSKHVERLGDVQHTLGFINDDPAHVVEWYEAGWPVRTMTRRGADDSRPRAEGAAARLLQRGVPLWEGRSLPLRPLWPEFLLSVLGWAAVSFGTLCAWREARAYRARRRGARGGCSSCGYDIGDLAICPECGRAREAP